MWLYLFSKGNKETISTDPSRASGPGTPFQGNPKKKQAHAHRDQAALTLFQRKKGETDTCPSRTSGSDTPSHGEPKKKRLQATQAPQRFKQHPNGFTSSPTVQTTSQRLDKPPTVRTTSQRLQGLKKLPPRSGGSPRQRRPSACHS